MAVIGGGTAGLNSAMAAAERGLKVLVAEKANIARGEAIAGGASTISWPFLRQVSHGTPGRPI